MPCREIDTELKMKRSKSKNADATGKRSATTRRTADSHTLTHTWTHTMQKLYVRDCVCVWVRVSVCACARRHWKKRKSYALRQRLLQLRLMLPPSSSTSSVAPARRRRRCAALRLLLYVICLRILTKYTYIHTYICTQKCQKIPRNSSCFACVQIFCGRKYCRGGNHSVSLFL